MVQRVRAGVAAGALLAAALAAPSQPAAANFADDLSGNCWYDLSTECYADGYRHDFYGGDLGPRMGAQVLSTLYGSYDTTTLDVVAENGHTTGVDIYYHNGYIPDEAGGIVVGKTSCQSPNNSHYCNHNHIIFDGDQIWNATDAGLNGSPVMRPVTAWG